MGRPFKGNKHKTFKNRTQIYFDDGNFFIVDNEDWQRLSKYSWHITTTHKTGKTPEYVIKTNIPGPNGSQYRLALHRTVMEAPARIMVDHIDGNWRNNRKANLRLVTPSQNAMNRRSRIRDTIPCVTRRSGRGKWRISISVNGQRKDYGGFNEKSLAEDYARYLKNEIHGEFSPYWKKI